MASCTLVARSAFPARFDAAAGIRQLVGQGPRGRRTRSRSKGLQGLDLVARQTALTGLLGDHVGHGDTECQALLAPAPGGCMRAQRMGLAILHAQRGEHVLRIRKGLKREFFPKLTPGRSIVWC